MFTKESVTCDLDSADVTPVLTAVEKTADGFLAVEDFPATGLTKAFAGFNFASDFFSVTLKTIFASSSKG